MKSIRKRWGSLTLSLAAISLTFVGLTPAQALANPWVDFSVSYEDPGTPAFTLSGSATGAGSLVLPAHKTFELDLNGYTLTVNGIHESSEGASDGQGALVVPAGTTLTIRDSVGTGKLIAHAGTGSQAAGIGGDNPNRAAGASSSGTIIIAGGTVSATGDTQHAENGGSGIGSGYLGSSQHIAISGGSVNAVGGQHAAGIGSARGGYGGTVVISGGQVTAVGGERGAGIGTGTDPQTWSSEEGIGSVQVLGGVVDAYGGTAAPGIGGGSNAAMKRIEIGAGASVTAQGGNSAIAGGSVSALGAGQHAAWNSPATITVAGSLTLPDTASLFIGDRTVFTVSGAVTNSGHMTMYTSDIFAGDGAIVNHGAITGYGFHEQDLHRVTVNNYAVEFFPNNGDASTVTRVFAATLEAGWNGLPMAPTKTDAEFVGWEANGAAFTETTELTGDTRVEARWKSPDPVNPPKPVDPPVTPAAPETSPAAHQAGATLAATGSGTQAYPLLLSVAALLLGAGSWVALRTFRPAGASQRNN